MRKDLSNHNYLKEAVKLVSSSERQLTGNLAMFRQSSSLHLTLNQSSCDYISNFQIFTIEFHRDDASVTSSCQQHHSKHGMPDVAPSLERGGYLSLQWFSRITDLFIFIQLCCFQKSQIDGPALLFLRHPVPDW